MSVQLGQHVTDKLTGHAGIVTGRAQYLDPTREAQALVTASRHDLKSEHWIDESRLVAAHTEATSS